MLRTLCPEQLRCKFSQRYYFIKIFSENLAIFFGIEKLFTNYLKFQLS